MRFFNTDTAFEKVRFKNQEEFISLLNSVEETYELYGDTDKYKEDFDRIIALVQDRSVWSTLTEEQKQRCLRWLVANKLKKDYSTTTKRFMEVSIEEGLDYAEN